MATAGTDKRREDAPPVWAARLAGLCLAVLCLAPPAAGQGAAQQASLTAVRHWSLGEVTRIAVETSREVRFRHDRLRNPDRLYFDLLDARSVLAPKGAKVFPVGDQLVQQIRVAQTQRTVARVVIDLVRPAEFTTSQLANPPRLIIELRAAGKGEAPPASVSEERKEAPPAVAAAVSQPREEAVPPAPESPAQAAPHEKKPGGAAAASRGSDGSRAQPSAQRSKPPARPAPGASPAGAETPPPKQEAAAGQAAAQPPSAEPVPPPPPAVPAKRNTVSGGSLTRALGLKLGRIVLDPGHGGHDHGTIGPKGLTEKELVLDIAQRLGALIEERMGSEVIFTRTSDIFVPLETRTLIANEARADLFLSIHANSSRMTSIAGVETFYLDFTTSKDDLDVAARENASSDKKIFELEELVKKIALTDKVKESREFAAKVQQALHSGLSRGNSRVRDRGVKKAPFIVLIGASMPSVLVEIGFVSNPREEALFSRPEYREKVAESLLKGVMQYAATLSHFAVARSGRD